jgi:hypothetical protein
MNNRIGDNLIHFGANEDLVRALSAAGVNFVVVGGLAVAWYCAERQADDMDLLVEPTAENFERIALALAKLRINCFLPESFAKYGLQIPIKNIFYAELLTPQQEAPTFSEIEADAIDAKLFNIPVRIASVFTLIEMKKRAVQSEGEQHDKHLKDIALLTRYWRLHR